MLLAAMTSNTLGLACIALAMEPHWRQLRGARPLARRMVALLRTVGALGLSLSLWLCLRADHATMAVLVWVMTLSAGALAVAFALAWMRR